MFQTPLPLEKQNSKRHFINTHHNTPCAQKVYEYLVQVHVINVPDNFPSSITLAHRQYHSSVFDMNLSLVDSIVEACSLWKEYVEDWDALVCREVLSMAKIHTSVVWVRGLVADGIALKKQPSYYFETTVRYNGTIKISG